jgi:hypothetical protein
MLHSALLWRTAPRGHSKMLRDAKGSGVFASRGQTASSKIRRNVATRQMNGFKSTEQAREVLAYQFCQMYGRRTLLKIRATEMAAC